jgi:hypothetical protein
MRKEKAEHRGTGVVSTYAHVEPSANGGWAEEVRRAALLTAGEKVTLTTIQRNGISGQADGEFDRLIVLRGPVTVD